MTRTTVPASKGSATFADSQVVVDLTVLNTLPGDVVEIIDDTSLAVLGTALQVGTSTAWRASLTLPASVAMVNISARNRRGLAYSGKLANPFAISYSGGPTDPFSANTVFLMNADIIDTPTHFVDSSSFARVIQAIGTAELSTVQKKYGVSSLKLGGVGNYVKLDYPPHFALEDWTIEFYVYHNSVLNDGRTCCYLDTQGMTAGYPAGGITIYKTNAGFINLNVRAGNCAALPIPVDKFRPGEWQHLAMSKLGDNFLTHVDGQFINKQVNGIPGQNITQENNPMTIGGGSGSYSSNSLDGSMDDIRITLGVSRYSEANFVPPGPTSKASTTPTPTPTGSAYQYWRVFCTADNGANLLQFQEIELFNAGGTQLFVPTPDINTSASSVYSSGYPAAKAFDGSSDPQFGSWAAATAPMPQWIAWDMGTSVQITTINLFPVNYQPVLPGRSPKDFVVQARNSLGDVWTDLVVFTNITAWTAGTAFVMTVPAVVSTPASTPAPADPYWNNVVLLMSGQAATDSSSYNRPVTMGSGAALSTGQAKFGTKSLAVTAGVTDSYFSVPGSTDFTLGTDDFTIEYWVFVPTLVVGGAMTGIWTGPDNYPYIYNWATGLAGERNQPQNNILFTATNSAGFVYPTARQMLSNGATFLEGQWNHVAYARTYPTLHMWINGVHQAFFDTANNGALDMDISISNVNLPTFNVGRWGPNATTSMSAFYQDIRITKGVNRYGSTNFTPPGELLAPAPTPTDTPAPTVAPTDTPAPTDSYRYWRVLITNNNGDPYTSMQQVELRTLVGGMSVCPTSPVTSQSDFFSGNMNTASKLCNRDYTEFQLVPWVSATDVPVPHWIYIDLGSPMKIIEAAIFCQNFSGGPARAPKDFLIQGSDNPTNWTTYTTATGINSWIPGTGKVFAVQPGLVLTA